MTKPVIYGPNFSTYVRSVRLALEEKAVEYGLHEVNILAGEHIQADHLARNPFGKVPSFSHDGLTVYETSAILRYIDRAFPGVTLQSSEIKQAARGDMAIGIIDSFAYSCMIGKLVWQRMVTPMLGGTPDDAIVAESLDRVRLCTREFDRLLAGHPWFGGASVGLADLHVAPVFAYVIGTEEGREIIGGFPALSDWFERMSARDSMQKTQPVFG